MIEDRLTEPVRLPEITDTEEVGHGNVLEEPPFSPATKRLQHLKTEHNGNRLHVSFRPMKYRIFQLGVEFPPNHPQRTPLRTKSLALGYTSEDSLEKATSILLDSGNLYKVKVERIDSPAEFQTLEEVSEPEAIKRLKASEAYPYCYIEPFTTG